jgi:uncharacterized membrane protein
MGNVKAKDVSLLAKIIGVVIILGGSILKWTGIFADCNIQEVCLVGFAVMGMFGTVDINIMLDKIFKKTVE